MVDATELAHVGRASVASKEIVELRVKHWGPETKGLSLAALAAHLLTLTQLITNQMAAGALIRSQVAELGALCVFLMEATDG